MAGQKVSSIYVGRIGALAVALGIGGAIGALSATACADSGEARESGASASTQRAGASDAADRRQAGPRPGFADRASGDSPTPAVTPSRAADRPAADAKRATTRLAAPEAVAAPVADQAGDPAAPLTVRANATALTVAPAASVSRAAAAVSPAAAYDAVTAAIGNADPDDWAAAQESYESFQAFFDGVPADQVLRWLFDTQTTELTGAAQTLIATRLPDLAPIAGSLAPTVVSGVGNWIFNGTVAPEITLLANDPAFLGFLAGQAAQGVADWGLPPAVSSAVGTAAAGLVQNVLGSNAGVRAAVDTFLGTLPGSQWTDAELLYNLWRGDVTFARLISDQISAQALSGIPALLATPAVYQALGGATASGIAALAGNAAVTAYVGDQVGQWLAPQLGEGPAAVISDAVAGLLSDPAVGAGLAAVAGSAVTAFLGQPGVADTLGAAAGDVIDATLAGSGVYSALWSVWPSLRNDATLTAALGAAVTAALNTVDTAVLGNPAVPEAVGDAVTAAITGIAGDPAARAMLAELASEFLGGNAASAVAGLLTDPSLAAVAGAAVTGFLNAPGVGAALTANAGQVASAWLAGGNLSAALSAALWSLQDNPAIQAALGVTLTAALQELDPESLGSTVTTLVTELTSDPAFRDVIDEQLGAVLGDDVADLLGPLGGDLAEALVPAITDLLAAPGIGPVLTDVVGAVLSGADPMQALQNALTAVEGDPALQDALGTAISGALNSILGDEAIREAAGTAAQFAINAALAESGLGEGFATTASQVAGVAVTALLGNPVVGNLIGDVAADILGGLPTEELAGTLIQTVLTNGELQSAVGFAIGQGIGSLLGDNVLGAIVGGVSGLAVTVLIQFGAGLVGLFAPVGAAAAMQNQSSPTVAAWWLPVAVA